MYVASLWSRSFFFVFVYGESPRTPPLEGTSLHRRHNRYSVERPWGILSLFTTCFRLGVNSPFQRWHKQNYMYLPSLWSGSFFLQWITADPSPWGNFTPPMKQQCGETLGDLSLFTPISRLRVISACHRLYVTQTCRVFVEQATWSSLFFLPWISAGREGWGYPSIFPISNGCHTSTWHTSESNNEHVLGNNTWTCGLRSILKHNTWGYISCHFKMTTQLHQPQKSKVNRSWGVWNVHLSLIPIWLPKSVLLLSVGAKNQVWIHFQGDDDAYIRGSIGFRDWFPMLSIKRKNQRSFSFKAHCVWKKLP